MTELRSPAADAPPTEIARPPTGRGLRLGLAVVAPVSALTIAATDLVAPYQDADPPRAILDAVAASPGAVEVM